MKEETKTRINISAQVYSKLNEIKNELKLREVNQRVQIEDILTDLFDLLDEKLISQYIEDKTPDHYKLKELSQNEEFNDDLKKLIKQYEKKRKSQIVSSAQKNEFI